MATGSQPTPADLELDQYLFKHSGANARSIPEAVFIENVEALCKERENKAIVGRLQDLYSKYQYMQSNVIAQRSSLKTKLPDISQALETVSHLVERRDKGGDEAVEYTYQLSENIYSKAAVPPTNNVCLWLGANCMLEYTLDEASELLRTNEANAKSTLKSVEEDMAFLRDQITTTEVNIARTHNYGVKLRQKEPKEDATAASSSGAAADAQAEKFSPASRTPVKSGGEGKGYSWKQESEEVEVFVPMPTGAKKGDIKVTILAESLKVQHSGKEILAGRFAGKCSPNGSTWTLSKGRLEITLQKADATPWSDFFEASD